MRLSKKFQVLEALLDGRTLTADQARSWYGVKNLRATMSRIRNETKSHYKFDTFRSSRNKTHYFLESVKR